MFFTLLKHLSTLLDAAFGKLLKTLETRNGPILVMALFAMLMALSAMFALIVYAVLIIQIAD